MDKIEPKGGETQSEDPAVQQKQPAELSVEKKRKFTPTGKLNKSPLHGLWALTNRDLRKSPCELRKRI